jgi:hypothetical protein
VVTGKEGRVMTMKITNMADRSVVEMPDDNELDTIIRQKAPTDAGYAIAYGLILLAGAQAATARRLGDLGNGNASTSFGAIEALSMQIKEGLNGIASSLGNVSEALERDRE